MSGSSFPAKSASSRTTFGSKGGALFAFAGLWTQGPTPDAPPTCAIITTTANELLAAIHGRMPVILDPEDEALWLDPGPVAPVKVLPCSRPLPNERLEAYPVSALVSSSQNEGSQLVEQVTVEGGPSTATISGT
jgi:putative SOS response-associated peptidase YedK